MPAETLPDDYIDYDDSEDEDDLLEDECGMLGDGTCQLAGTEWCDWECPLQRQSDRIVAMKAREKGGSNAG